MGTNGVEPGVSDLLMRVSRRWRGTASERYCPESVLLATAARYSAPSTDFSVTPPTGFDPEAAALFEAIVESAFLVANADGDFDATERQAFTMVVLEASQRRVSERQLSAIVLDLETQLSEDGPARRLQHLSKAVVRDGDRREALRIAALLAQVSAGVSEAERRVLEELAAAWDLTPSAVDDALRDVATALDESSAV